ncbi:D-Ala-D-Ala carboxypeptidase family metallohydrolase [Salinarimonas sp.]|uniref:YcbK family protein n=1 Tax=Salinarimonas sp. TaxID=2766526 RepID=UPI0032D9A769
MRIAFHVRAPLARATTRPAAHLLAALLLTALPMALADPSRAEGLSHVYATIKPPEVSTETPESGDAEGADQQARSDAERYDETEAVASATPPPLPAGDGGLANVYATLKPAERLEEDLDEDAAAAQARREIDVDTTGALPRTLGGFAAKVDAGAIWVRESAPTRCLPGDLTQVVAQVAERFGAVRIMSTHRSASRNRRAGGAPRSMHLSCRAIDFRVAARGRQVLAFLRDHPAVGGLKLYRSGLIHIDDGERRSW